MEFPLQQEPDVIRFHDVCHCDYVELFEHTIAPKPFKVPVTGRQFVSRYMQILTDNFYRSEFNHIEAASLLSISHRQLHRKLSSNIGMNFNVSLRKFRLFEAASLCRSGLQVSQIVESVGFSSFSYFVKCFKHQFGVTPKQYQLELK